MTTTVPSASEPIASDPKEARKALGSGIIGTALEWTDFALYALLSATVFPVIFFADLGPTAAVLVSFLTFAVGYVARPLGSVIFGYMGDRVGRKQVLYLTLVLMAIVTLVIAVLPPASAIGGAAPVILVLMRFLQGLALGGEATGSQLLSMEHAPINRRGLFGGLTLSGSPMSQVLANALLLILAATLSEDDYFSWGWRIPFALSIVLLLVGVYVRIRVKETPIFEEAKAEKPKTPSLIYVFRHHTKYIVRNIFIHAALSITYNFITVYCLQYLTAVEGWSQSDTLMMLMIANVVGIPAVIFGGWMADRIGRRQVYAIGIVLCGLSAIIFFPLAGQHNFFLTILVCLLAVAGVQFANGAQSPLFAEAFPTHVRFQGAALSLTLGNVFFGALMPFVSALMLSLSGGDPIGIVILWVSICVISFLVAVLSKNDPSLENLPQKFRGRQRTDLQEVAV